MGLGGMVRSGGIREGVIDLWRDWMCRCIIIAYFAMSLFALCFVFLGRA